MSTAIIHCAMPARLSALLRIWMGTSSLQIVNHHPFRIPQAENQALQDLVRQQSDGGAAAAKRLAGLKAKYQQLSTKVRGSRKRHPPCSKRDVGRRPGGTRGAMSGGYGSNNVPRAVVLQSWHRVRSALP